MTAVIVDTSAIIAGLDESYPEHLAVARILAAESSRLILSSMVVAEADYMLAARLGTEAARRFAADVAAEAYELAEWSATDHANALEVTNQFSDTKDYIGVTDAANVILADRYRTTRILSLDQRHFRVLRPLWGADHFQILPYDA